jgi:hypothetical protein
MHQECGARISRSRHHGADHGRESRFTEGAKSEAGQRNAQLHGGNDAMQIAEQDLDDAGTGVAFAHELTHAREAYGNEGELRRGKKAVERDERKDPD